MGRYNGLTIRNPLGVRPVGSEIPRLSIVAETDREQSVKPGMESDIIDRRDGFHTTIEIARHPVGGTEVELLLAVVGEVEEPRVLEESADNAHYFDPVTHARNAGPQTADSTHDQIDIHARLRCGIQRF